MSKKTVDQHGVLNRWREIADELAEALRMDGHNGDCPSDAACSACRALRRYEEARDA